MSMNIDLSAENTATLAAQARAAGMLPERYLAQIVAHALERHRADAARKLSQHLDYMASQVRPDVTTQEMEAALEEALAAVRPRRNWQP